MRIDRRTWMRAMVATAVTWPWPANGNAATASFRLEDQWERPTSSTQVFGKPVALVGGDQRASGDRIAEWAVALAGWPVVGIVDLGALPFFVPKGSVRKNLREVAPKTAVLLDWKGAVYGPVLGFPASTEVLVHVYGADGTKLLQVTGWPDAARVASVTKALRGER